MSNCRCPSTRPDDSPVAALVARDEAARAIARSTRASTSRSKPRPARGRRACWSIATSTCCARASIRRNVLAMTFTRKAAAEMRERILASLERRRSAARSRRRAGASCATAWRHRDQHHRRLLPVAAAGVPARGRSRSRLLRGRRHRGAASGRRVARPRAADLPRAGAGGRARRAGLCATGRPACASGPGARCSPAAGRARPARPLLTQGPRDWTVQTVADRGAASLARVVAGMAGGLEQFSVTGPLTSRSRCSSSGCARWRRRRTASTRRWCTTHSFTRAGIS